MQEMTFWRRVVQRVVAPPAQTSESSAGRGVAWSKYDFVGWPYTPSDCFNLFIIIFKFLSHLCADLRPPRKHDTELICKNLCNGFGLRGAGGQCYAYGVYPAASYFSTHRPSSHTTHTRHTHTHDTHTAHNEVLTFVQTIRATPTFAELSRMLAKPHRAAADRGQSVLPFPSL
jgi:hypothetical protein